MENRKAHQLILSGRFRCAEMVVATAILIAFPLFAGTGGVIFGRVVDQTTGEPLRKVKIALRPTEMQAVTDDEGNYRLEGVSGGNYTLQVSTIGYRLLKKEIRIEEGESKQILFYLGQEATTIRDTVIVTAPVFAEVEKSAPSQIALNSTEIKNLAGVLLDDPLRSVQTLPGVATGDDFNSAYSVRGGGFNNNGIMIDGVLTHNIAHTVQGTQEPAGSVTILNGDLVESMALFSGAFSAKYGDRTASFLDIVTREGSRDRTRARLAVSGSNAAFVAEGPLDAAKKGAWIASARKSYAGYLVRRLGPETNLNMGFTDAQGKMVYDLNSRHHLGASFIWGKSGMSRDPTNLGTTSMVDGANKVEIANLSWTWIPGPKWYWESRTYLIRETFENYNKDDQLLDRGGYTEAAARGDLSYQLPHGHRIESGFLARYITSNILDRRYNYTLRQFYDFDSAHGRYWQHAAYVQDRWETKDGNLSAIIGARIDTAGLTGQTLVHPRASIEWQVGKANKLDAGWGVFSQFPEVLPVLGRNGDPDLRAEIARHYVLGYERLLGDKSRIRVELFDKQEGNLMRDRDSIYRIVKGKVTAPDINFHYDNGLNGYTRGAEVFFQRRSANRLAGWVSYSYSVTRRHDLVTGETYNAECDQRHTVNIYGSYRFSESWNLSMKARVGSGFPYPAYFEQRGADFYLTTERNAVRLPLYSRVDLRLNKAFYFKRRKLSLYIEILNLMNHDNMRYDRTSNVNASTRKVSLSRDSLLPILPTAGFVLEF